MLASAAMIRRTAAVLPFVALLATAVPATAAPAPTVVNVSHRATSQSEAAVAASPLDPNDVVIASNVQHGYGIFVAVSHDGGATWSRRRDRRRRRVRSGVLRPDDRVGPVRERVPVVDRVRQADVPDGAADPAEHRRRRLLDAPCAHQATCRGRAHPSRRRARRAGVRRRSARRRGGSGSGVPRPADDHDRRSVVVGDLEQRRTDAGGRRPRRWPRRGRAVQEGARRSRRAQLHLRRRGGRPRRSRGAGLPEGSGPVRPRPVDLPVHGRRRRGPARPVPR